MQQHLFTRLGISLFAGLTLVACSTTRTAEPMTQSRLETIIKEQATEASGQGGVVEFTFDSVRMACVSDVKYDRMRIIAAVARERDITDEQRKKAPVVNFHTALDARYASSQGVLYAAYIHPLSSLAEAELVSALRQVVNLARTFGTAYSSGTLTFHGQTQE